MNKFGLQEVVRNIGVAIGVIMSLALLASCTSSPKIHSLMDKEADFTRYKTYGFAEKLGTDESGYSSLVTKYLKASITRELDKRGYQQSNEPDLIVNFYVKSEEKVQVRTSPSSSASVAYRHGYYGYRAGVYSPWPQYDHDTQVTQYSEGTLNIDLVDAKQRQLVWEGVAVGRVPKDVLDDLDARIDKVVTQIFAKYSFVAGT